MDDKKDQIDENEDQEAQDEGTGKSASDTSKSSGAQDGGEESEAGKSGDRLTEEVESDEEEVDSETLALARLLQNKDTRAAVIQALVKDSKVEDKVSEGQSAKQIVRSVKEDLRTALGKDWEFLAEKLSPVFDALVNHVASVEARLGNQISQTIVETSNQAAEKFFASTPEAKKLEPAMIKLMEDYEPPKDKSKLQSYLKRLYILAKEESSTPGKALADKVKERIDKNSQQTVLRTGSQSGQADPKVYKTSREAVLAAVEQLNKK